MIHSASLWATGSEIAASAWVASAALCLRASSMTFSRASVSAREVEEVAAIAAGAAGGRAGKAVCWRVGGVRLAVGEPAVATTAVFLVTGFVAADVALGTTPRAIGRGFGNGTLDLAHASAAQSDKPTANNRPVAPAVDRRAAVRKDKVTAFPDGESFNRSSPSSI